jgi:hypothetical protein
VAIGDVGYVQLKVYTPDKPVTFTSNCIPGVLAHQLLGVAVIAPGVAGAPFTVMQRAMLLPQALLAVTHTVPVLNVPYNTFTDVVP